MTKTCRNGHPRTPENTRLSGKKRYCRTCQAEAAKRYRANEPDWPVPAGGDAAMVARMMLYGARYGGVGKLTQEDCERWLSC